MKNKDRFRRQLPLHLMILPGLALVILFQYIPMFGLAMAFQKFVPIKGFLGSSWIGLGNFDYLLNLPSIGAVVYNTLFIAIMKILAGILVPLVFALLLNELRSSFLKKGIQTVVFLPFFLSWVILGGILIDILSPSEGVLGRLITAMGGKAVFFLGDAAWFPWVAIITETWKNFGYNTVIYLAALTAIDPALYEAAKIDGAGRWRQTLAVTLPGILPIVTLVSILSLGNVLNAGFDQIFNLYSPQVYSTGDILDTLVYRIGLVDAQYSVATAIGLIKSVVSFVLIVLSYFLANRFSGYRVF